MSAPVLVFDIGNVLVDWDPRYLYRQMFPQAPAAMEWFLETICTPAWNLEQDGGRTWAEGVGILVARYPEWRAEIEAFDARWHEMIPDVIPGSIALLDELRQAGIRLLAITNFSTEKYAESFRRFEFLSWFAGVVVSGDERLLKPHAPIFALLCERYGVAPGDCIFVDDKAENVTGAERAGMKGLVFTSADTLRADLASLGVLHA